MCWSGARICWCGTSMRCAMRFDARGLGGRLRSMLGWNCGHTTDRPAPRNRMAWLLATKWVVGAASIRFCTSSGMLSRGVELPERNCSGSRISTASMPNCGIERASVAMKMAIDVVAKRCSAAATRNSANEPAIGTRKMPCTTNTSAILAASRRRALVLCCEGEAGVAKASGDFLRRPGVPPRCPRAGSRLAPERPGRDVRLPRCDRSTPAARATCVRPGRRPPPDRPASAGCLRQRYSSRVRWSAIGRRQIGRGLVRCSRTRG